MIEPDPVPRGFDPALEALDRHQLEQLISEVSPEVFYLRAAAFDNAVARLTVVRDDLRHESRRLSDHWDGEVADGFQDAARSLADRLDLVLDAMSVPGYGQAMNNAGDALALAQQRLRAGGDPPAQPGAVPVDPAAAEQSGQRSALQILRDLCTAYYDVGRSIVPMPEAGAGRGPGAGDVAGTGPGEDRGAGENVEHVGPTAVPAGHPEGFWAPNAFGAGVFGPGAIDGGALGFARPGGSAAGSAAVAGAADEMRGMQGAASAAQPVSAPSDVGTESLEPMPVWGSPAVLGRPGGSPVRRSKKLDERAAKGVDAKGVDANEVVANSVDAGAADQTSRGERPVTVSVPSGGTAQVMSTEAAGPVAHVPPVGSAASAGATAQATASGPAAQVAPAAGTARAHVATPPPQAVPERAAVSAIPVAENVAASATAKQQVAAMSPLPETGPAASSALHPRLAEGAAASGGAVPPVRPLADLTATQFSGGSPGPIGAGIPVDGSGARQAAGMQPAGPMMFGGLPGHHQDGERVPEVSAGPGPGVWDFGDGIAPVLGRVPARTEASRADSGGPAVPLKQEDLKRRLEEEILGRVRKRELTDD
ncbi:hypothetical protein [Amycolatopsis sp. lyj-109]|uniref:WXG100 family type VII secretion target n=1 Tax=Amycolatopsis sp. lyj-109 TaxID=2789287 RepID=UPI00397A7338